MEDHRDVPLEVLRDFVRSYADVRSIRVIAEDAGLPYNTVRGFVHDGKTPHPRTRRLLALWYLRRLHGVDEFETLRPYVSALRVLLAQAPEPDRDRVMLAVLAGVESGYAAIDVPPPRWVGMLRDRIMRTRPVL